EPLKSLLSPDSTPDGRLVLGSGKTATARLLAAGAELNSQANSWYEGTAELAGPAAVGVFIGIDHYKDTDIRHLDCTVKDAQEMASTLQEHYGLNRTWVLTDERASLRLIRKTLVE